MRRKAGQIDSSLTAVGLAVWLAIRERVNVRNSKWMCAERLPQYAALVQRVPAGALRAREELQKVRKGCNARRHCDTTQTTERLGVGSS